MAKFTEQAVSAAFQPYLQTGESLTNAAHCIYVARFLPLGLIRALFTKFYIVGLTNQRVIILSLANRFGGNVNVAEVRGYPLDRLPVINATFGTFATGLRINDPAAPFRATFASVGVPGNYQRGQMIAKELLERWQNKGAIEVSRENFDQAKFETPKSQILPQSTPSSAAPAQFGQPTVAPQYQPQQTSGTLYGCLSAALIAAGSGLLLLSTLVIVAMILDKTKTTRDTIGGIVVGGTMVLFATALIAVGIYIFRQRRTVKNSAGLAQSSSGASPHKGAEKI